MGTPYASTVPSTIADIFTAAGASSAGVVRWGTSLAPPTPRAAPAAGIYVVALTDQLDSRAGALAASPNLRSEAAASALEVRLGVALKALDRSLGLRIAGLAEEPADLRAPQNQRDRL